MAPVDNTDIGIRAEPGQQDVVDFLSRPEAYTHIYKANNEHNWPPVKIDSVTTHSAYLFLVGEDVYKIKRAVSYTYLDMSSLDKRRRLCVREIELNQAVLPDIYIKAIPISREADGSLRIDGSGEPVEWAVYMKRFNEYDVLDNMAREGQLTIHLAGQIGQSIARYHARLDYHKVDDGYTRIEEVVMELNHELARFADLFSQSLLDQFEKLGYRELGRCQARLNSRAASGYIKRCHGDLHLRNIVMHDGIPVPFDALEFDERMATTDVLYDLAFLLMDLEHRGLNDQANATFNQYLAYSDENNIRALDLLPLFLFCRAGIRAMTTAQAINPEIGDSEKLGQEAREYLKLALTYLHGTQAVLVAIGGLSGTGKSTVSRRLAGVLGSSPGALLIRSDSERKIAHGLDETQRLPPSHYTSEASRLNYELLLRKATLALEAQHPVVVDAVFLDSEFRRSIEAIAVARGIPFVGVWLEAPVYVLQQRIAQRQDDASDATVDVLEKQLAKNHGNNTWRVVDAIGTTNEVFARVERMVNHCCSGRFAR